MVADTWEYLPSAPASYATFGAGCAGAAGTPIPANPALVGRTYDNQGLAAGPAGLVASDAAAATVGAK